MTVGIPLGICTLYKIQRKLKSSLSPNALVHKRTARLFDVHLESTSTTDVFLDVCDTLFFDRVYAIIFPNRALAGPFEAMRY